MRYEELAPPPALRGVVHRFWVLQGRASSGDPFQRAMPDGRAELIFNFADPFECIAGGTVLRQPRWLLVGPSCQAMRIRPTGRVDVLGVRFRPEALAGWLRVGGQELAGAALALEEIGAPFERSLPERMAQAAAQARVGMLVAGLVSTAGEAADPRVAAAVDLVLRAGAKPEMAAEHVGVSRRQLGRLFRDRVGLGPKSLGRLGRFQRVLRALETEPRLSLARVAASAGYFDQAHLSREFRLLAGTTPGRHRREMRELTRHFLDSPG